MRGLCLFHHTEEENSGKEGDLQSFPRGRQFGGNLSQSYFLSVCGGVTGLNGSRRISGEGPAVRFPGGSWPRFRGALIGSDKCDRATRQFEVRENRQRHRDELRVKAGGAAGKAKSNFGKTMGPLSGGGANC